MKYIKYITFHGGSNFYSKFLIMKSIAGATRDYGSFHYNECNENSGNGKVG